MGGCFSKPTRSHDQEGPAQQSPNVPPVTAAPSAGPAAGPTQDTDRDTQQLSSEAPSAAASAQLPTVLDAWSPADVLTWAAGLGLGPAAAAALQGCSGQQLLQVTDKGLLQLGVQDAAERQALLTARKNLQQQQQQDQQQQQHKQQQQQLQPQPSANGAEQALVLPAPSTPTGGSAGQGQPAPAGADEAGAQDAQASTDDSKKAGVRFAPSPTHARADQESGGAGQQPGSGDMAAALVEQGETQDIQVLRITSAGRFFRHNRPVPVSLVPLCQAVCMLHDVRRGAHYHQDNCHHLLQRLILVQDYLLALPLSELQQHGVLLAKLSVLVQDVYDVFNQFADRGWCLRLLGPVRDQDDFSRLDQQLVNALQQAGVDTSEPPLIELREAHMYQPQQQALEAALKSLGITRLMRDPLSATLRLQSLLKHLPSGSNIEVLLQQEIDFYLSSTVQFIDSSSDSLDNGPGSRQSSDSNVPKGVSGGSSAQQLRRSSSSSPLVGGRARATAMAAMEPYMVLRNDTVRAEWRSVFGSRERIPWKDFWHKLVQPQPHIWGLDRQLDKFTTDYVQQHLQRGSHGLLTLSEMDFAFPPNVSPAMIVQGRLRVHQSVSSAGINPVQFGARQATSKHSKLPGGIGWLREVRHLQDPNPRLHNMPEFPSSYIARDDEVAELVLSMADVSTNLVMLTGAQGVGRSLLAASLAQELVSSQHWTDAYWIDMQGISNVVLAGQQLMAGLGLVSDVSDTQQLLAWLEGRPRERFGIVLTHVQDLVMAPAEEHQGFLDLLDNILHSSHKLQVVVVCEEALPRTMYSARTNEVGPLAEALATEMVMEAQPGMSEEHCRFIVDVCSGAPVALSVVCNLLRYGHCDAAEFVRLYTDPRLPLDRSLSNTNTNTNFLPFESRATNERLQRVIVTAMVNLPDVLVGTLFVLSLLPSPFTLELYGPLLALAQTKPGKHAVLRRLVNLGLLSYNPSLQQYSMHKVVREAARLLAHNLDLPFNETRTNYAERVVSTARRLVLPLIKKNRMLSARLAWSRLAVHGLQLLNWAFQEVKPELLPLYVGLAWDLTPLLSSSCSSHTLQGFCQVVLERSQFLDANVESAKMMTVLASLLAESGAHKRADTLLRQALELFWRELKDPTPAVARCYRELGALMLKAGKAAEAAKHLQQALDIKEPLYGSTSPELLTVLQLQVELLRRSRKYAEAEHVCQRALGICGAAYGPSDVQVAFWKNQLAQVLRQAGRASEAQSLSEEALSLLQGQLGSDHPRVAAQLMILGQLAAQQNKQAVAEQTFRKALQVYQTVSGLHHPDTFNCLTSLVALLRGAGKASQALPLAQRCLAVKKKSLGELHPDTAASMQVVADVMLDLGKYAEVEANCQRAVWVYQQINQPANSRPVITATTMQALALVLLGRASEAEQLATSCLEAAKQLPGPVGERNSFVASCFNCLGEVYREMGRLADSEAAAREGLAMREKDMGPEHPVVAISLQTLGHVLRLRQQLDEALEVAKRCEALRRTSSSQAQGPQMAAALYLQALIYSDMGRLDEAYEKAQASLAMRQKVLSSEHPDLAHSLTAVAEVLLLQGKFMDAQPLLSHAVQNFIGQLGSSHPATKRAHTLLKEANNPHTASSSMSMAMRLASVSTTDLGSSRLASKDLSRSNSLSRHMSGAAAAAGAAPPAAGADAVSAGAAGVNGAEQQPGEAAAAGGDVAGRQPSVGQGGETELSGSGRMSKAGSGAGASGLHSAAGSTSYSHGTNVAVSISTHIGAMQQAGSPAPSGAAASGYLDMQQRRSLDDAAGAGVRSADEGSSHTATGAAVIAGASAAAAAAAAAAASAAGSDDASGQLPADAAQPGLAAVRSGSLGGVPAAGATGQLLGSSGDGTAAAAASTQANPAQWELGRQLGQPVALASGAAEPDTGAYNMVLAELTRRASNTGTPEEEKALHEEGVGVPPQAAAAALTAQGAAAGAAAPAGGVQAAGRSVSGSGVAAGARGAAAGGAAGATTAAAVAAGGTTLAELSEAAGPGDEAAAAAAAAAEARGTAEGLMLDMEAAAAAGGDGQGPEGAAEVYEKKMAQLAGIADIESIKVFLREHGWQLSRLSDDREGSLARPQPAGTEGSDPIVFPAGAAEAAAAVDGAAAAGAGSAELDLPKSAPLPAAELGIRSGSAGADAGTPTGLGRRGPFAAAAQQLPEGQGFQPQQQQPQPRHQQQQHWRRPPARHFSFVQGGGRHHSPSQLEAAWSAGYPRSPRSVHRGALPGAGLPAYAGPYDEGGLQGQMGMQGGLAYQQQRLQRPRGDPTVWPEYLEGHEGDELAEHLYYQRLEAQLHAQEHSPWGQQPMHSRQAAPGSRTMTAADIAQVLEAMRQHYQPAYVDEDAYSASAAVGMHHAASGSLHSLHSRQQLSPAWSAGLVPGAGTYGGPRATPAAAAAAVPGRSRTRRRSFDAGAFRAAQAANSSSNIWSQAAAAAAAECGYPLQMQTSSELEQLQLQQQHMSSLYAAAVQQSAELAGLQQHQQQHQLAHEYSSGAIPPGVPGAGTPHGGGLARGGSGGSSNRGSGGASGSYAHGHKQGAGASGSLGPAVMVAGAGMLQGQRSSASTGLPLSPGVSGAEAQLGGLPAGGSRAASAGFGGPPGVGMLPKYPSNISNYSTVSASSARSGPREDSVVGQQGPLAPPAQGSGGSQAQAFGEDGGQAGPTGGVGVPPSGRSSRLGAISPEASSARQHDQQQQQQQQQQQNLIAARARSALGRRQGSGHSQAGGDMSPPSLVSPRLQQQQQQGNGGPTPSSSAPVSARSGRGVARPAAAAAGGGSRTPPQQQQQHYSGSQLDYGADQGLHEQQHLDTDMSPRYAAAAGGYRSAPFSMQQQQQRQQQQQQQAMGGHPRSPLLHAQLQQQALYDDEDQFGALSAAQQHYMDAADEAHWAGDMQHPGMAAALAVSAGMSAYHGPGPPVQYPAYMAGSGPASTGSAQGRVGNGGYLRMAAALLSMGLTPQALAAGGGGSQQQQQAAMLAMLQGQHPGGAEWAEPGEEEERLEAASKVVMLQNQVQNVQAARAELQNQQQEIEAYLAFTQMSGPEQQQVLDMLGAQQQHYGAAMPLGMQQSESPHMGPLNVLGTGMGSSSSSNAQAPRQGRGPPGMQQQQQQGPLPPAHPSGVALLPHEAAAAAAGAVGGGVAAGSSGAFLQRAASTASTGSLGSPKSTHSARARAAAMAVAAAGVRSGPLEPPHAGKAAGVGGEGGQGEAAAAAVAAALQLPGIATNGSSAPSPASSLPPGSPTGSRSTPSRSGLSRGASGSYEGQLGGGGGAGPHAAAGLPPATGAAGSGGSSRMGAGGGQGGGGSKGALLGQRSISPDRLRRPASASAVLGPQQQQKPLHRLHRDNSYDQQIGEVAEAAGTTGMAAAGQRAGGNGGMAAAPPLLPRSPTNAAMRGPAVAGMPPMPAAAWQQQQQQQQQMLPQQYVQMMLAQQQQQMQMQQQLQLPQQAMARRPARMSSPSPYGGVGGPTSPMALQGGSGSSYLPTSANAVAAALAVQQQQQHQQQFLQHGSSTGLAMAPSGSRQGLQGMGMGPPGGASAAGLRGPAMVAGGGMQGRPVRGPPSRSPASFSAGMMARPQQQQQQGVPGQGYLQAGGYPQMPGLGGHGFVPASHTQPGLTQAQMATLLLRQQQQQQQQFRQHGGAAAAALAAAAGGSRGSYGGSSQPDVDAEGQLHYQQGLGTQGSEDYGMWAAPPDYGGAVHADEASSRGASGNSRSFIAASGGQYWQGRRSNSWGNLPEAAGDLTSPRSSSLPRSQSSQDMPSVLAGVTEPAPAMQQP